MAEVQVYHTIEDVEDEAARYAALYLRETGHVSPIKSNATIAHSNLKAADLRGWLGENPEAEPIVTGVLNLVSSLCNVFGLQAVGEILAALTRALEAVAGT